MRYLRVLFFVSVCFFILCSYKLIFLNTQLHYDEAGNYLPAWNWVKHKQYAFTVQNRKVFSRTSSFITIGPYVGYSLIPFVNLLGTRWHLARVWIWIHAVILLTLLYFITQRHFNQKIAILTVCILTFNSVFITYSTRIAGEIPAYTSFLLGFWAYKQGSKKKDLFWYLLAAISFQISILSKEYFAVLIGLTLLFFWLYIDKRQNTPALWLGITLPSGVILYYFLQFRSISMIEEYFAQRQIYNIEFFAFQDDALKWVLTKPLILIGYALHSIRCYIRKERTDVFLWIFQTLYLFLFLISIGFERFGVGLLIIPSVYIAEFLIGMSEVPAISKTYRHMLYIIIAAVITQKSPVLLWKVPLQTTTLSLNEYRNRIIHTSELSIIPLLVEYPYHLPVYPPARFKERNYGKKYVKEVQEQYLKADILILGEYAFTEYKDVYDKTLIRVYFEKKLQQGKYEVWIKFNTKSSF